MVSREDMDAVMVISSNCVHAEHAMAAAQAGKHIFLEKPMAITLKDCRQIAEAVEKAGVKCDMGYHRRLSPLVRYTKNLIAEDKLGKLAFVESDYFHYQPGDRDGWKRGSDIMGNPIHGGTGHNIDLVRHLCGEIVEVSCFKDVVIPRKVMPDSEDVAVINLKFESGAMGRVGLFIGPIMPFTFTLRLFGSKGTVDNNRVWLDSTPRFYDYGHEQDYISLPQSWIWDNVQGGVSETWKECIDIFIDDIRLDREPFNDAKSGFNTAAVCFAAIQAAEENRVIQPEKM